jgi:heat shock protein HslJ
MTTFESRLGKRRIVFACLALAGLAGVARPVAAQSGVVEAIGPRLGKEYRLLQMVVAGQELPLPEESPITLKLLSDTVLGGKASVNLYFTGFDLDDQGHIYWRKPGFATTLMAGPPELMQLEQAFFAAMASTNTLSFAGADLVLADADSTTLTFRQADFDAAIQALYGKTLFLRRMIAGGTEVGLPPGAEITVSLTKDGRVEGLAAVNRYFGAWKQLAKGGIEMSRAFATTKMAGPPELMQAEDTFLRALAGVERIEISAGVLTLENAAKSIVLDFGPPR